MAVRGIDATQSYSPIKKAGKTAAKITTAAAATGAVLYMAKTGKLNPKEGGNKVVEGLKAGLKKPADFILNKGSQLKDKAKNNPKISAVTDKFSEKLNSLSEKAGEKKDAILSTIGKKVDTVKDFIESKSNSAKFN